MIETSLGWKERHREPRLRFSGDNRLLIAEITYERPQVIELPPTGEALVRQADAILANLHTAKPMGAPAGRKKSRLGLASTDLIADQARVLGLSAQEGALITETFAGSAAMNADLRIGDVIVEFDRKPVNNVDTFEAAVASAQPFKNVPIVLLRNKTRVEITATLGE